MVAGLGRTWQDVPMDGGKRRSRLRGRGVQKFRKVYLQICERWSPTPMHPKGCGGLLTLRAFRLPLPSLEIALDGKRKERSPDRFGF